MNFEDIVIYRSGEWSALYLNGDLQVGGDTYLIEDWLISYLNIKEIFSDAFTAGDTNEIFESLADVEAFEEARAQANDEAAKLRAEAQKLLDRAAELET